MTDRITLMAIVRRSIGTVIATPAATMTAPSSSADS